MLATLKAYLPGKPASIRLENLYPMVRVEDASRGHRITDVSCFWQGVQQSVPLGWKELERLKYLLLVILHCFLAGVVHWA